MQHKELPHDLLAEKTFVGCLLVDGQSFENVNDLKITKEDFYHPQYGVIFECVKDLHTENQPVDYVTVCSKLNEVGKLEVVGGQAGISQLLEDHATSANIYSYAKTIKDKSIMRQVVRTAMNVADQGMNFKGKTAEFIDEVESSFFKLTNQSKTGGLASIRSCVLENLKTLEDTSRNAGEISGVSTGYPRLDEYLLGLQPGQLVVLAARPAMGKTALALNMALRGPVNAGLPCVIFSLEMTKHELSMRMLTSLAKVSSVKIRKKTYDAMDLNNIANAVNDLANQSVWINDNGGTTLLDIQSHCRKIKAEQGLGLVIIDYLQLMRSHTNNPSREQQISEISRGLKSLAKELECPILALSQLNRAVESRTNRRPNNADLRESGAIEQDADIILFIYRDEVYDENTKEPGIAEIIVGKNRGGKIGTAKLAFVGDYTSFENLNPDQT